MTARRVAAAGSTPVLVAVGARLREDAVYMSPMGHRCAWVRPETGAGGNRYFLRYEHDRRSGFTLTRENLHILKEVQP